MNSAIQWEWEINFRKAADGNAAWLFVASGHGFDTRADAMRDASGLWEIFSRRQGAELDIQIQVRAML